MRYIIRAIESRMPYVEEMLKQIPEAEVLIDKSGNATTGFLNACKHVGFDACVMLEDDVILTTDFKRKIEAEIRKQPEMLINFFSLSKKYTSSHTKPWRQFCMSQCVYMPEFLCAACIDKFEDWKRDMKKGPNPNGGVDFLMAYAWHKDYFVYCPSLVQHLELKSAINPKRSSKRQSITFEP